MRNTTTQRKSCNIVISIDNEIMIKAFDNLGYKLVKQLAYPPDASAPGLPIFHFTKIG